MFQAIIRRVLGPLFSLLFVLEEIICHVLKQLLFPLAHRVLGILSRVLNDDDWELAYVWISRSAVEEYIRVWMSCYGSIFALCVLLVCVDGVTYITWQWCYSIQQIWRHTREKRNTLQRFLVFKVRRIMHTMGIVRRPTYSEYFDQVMQLAWMALALARIMVAQERWTHLHERLPTEELDVIKSNAFHYVKTAQALVNEEHIYYFEPVKALLDETLNSPGKVQATPEILAAIEYAKARHQFTEDLRTSIQHFVIHVDYLSEHHIDDYMRRLADRISFEAGELAFASAQHPRLGGESPAHGLSSDLVKLIHTHAFNL